MVQVHNKATAYWHQLQIFENKHRRLTFIRLSQKSSKITSAIVHHIPSNLLFQITIKITMTKTPRWLDMPSPYRLNTCTTNGLATSDARSSADTVLTRLVCVWDRYLYRYVIVSVNNWTICHGRDLWKLSRSFKQLCLLCPPDPWDLPGTALFNGFQSSRGEIHRIRLYLII